MTEHPFLDPTTRVRWSLLTADRVEPDILAAIERARTAIERIAAQPVDSVSFESTFTALDEATEELGTGWSRVGHLQSVNDAPDLREAYNTVLPKVSSFYAGIPLHAGLWTVLKAYAESAAGKAETGVRRRLIDETVAEFINAGADLPAEQKQRLEEIQEELSRLTQKFSENDLDATKAFELVIDDEARLAGLPAMQKEQAREDALQKGHGTEDDPRWRFTLQYPSVLPVLQYCDDDALRRDLWTAFSRIGATEEFDNTPLIPQILRLRQEKAEILGKANFADLVTERRMAKSGAAALGFVENLHRRTKVASDEQATDLEAFRAEQLGVEPEPLEPWETAYWTEKLRRARYDFDEDALRPYFPINAVIGGLFALAERVFDVHIEEKPSAFVEPGSGTAGDAAEVWHPEVKYYEITDADGALRGCFYADWHPRESKRSGAWFNELKTGGPRPEGGREPHVGLICGNLSKPVGGKAALLSHNEVLTVFHEFGHLIHHLLGDVEIRGLNGIHVAWDFVELPSQIMENWCWEREGLDFFARHHETGEPIPDDLFDKMTAARQFMGARGMMRQLYLGKMDLELHIHHPTYEGDYEELLRDLLKEYAPRLKTEPPTIARRFSHLFSSPTGYASGYYSYKWAEVLDADAFSRFKAEGVLNREIGRAFREKVLSRGNAADPAVLFRDFMGRDPDETALLERYGVA